MFSCTSNPPEYFITTTFVYKNLTSETITISLFTEDNTLLNKYVIEPGKEEKISINDAKKTGIGQPFRFRENKTGTTTKVIIGFESTNKCLTFLDGQGLLNEKLYDNFSESMYNTSNNTLIYNIDNQELDLATPCL
jgi:hypothetical protein